MKSRLNDELTGPAESETLTRPTIVTSGFCVLAVGTAAFDSVARNLALPDILRELHLSVSQGGAIFGAAFFVTFLANVVIGPMMDRIGRKRAMQVALLAAGLFSGLTAFVTQGWQYAIIGSLAGCTLVVQTTCAVLVGEEAPARWRGILMAFVQGSFSAGALLVGLVASALLPSGNWRLLFIITFAPILLLVLSQFVVSEPVRAVEARAVKASTELPARALTHDIDVARARSSEWRQLFAADVRRQTVVACVGGFLINFSTGFVLALTATFFERYNHVGIGVISLAITVESAAALAGSVIIGLLSNLVSARNLLVGFSILGAIAVALLAVRGGAGWIWLTMGLFGFFGQGALATWPRYIVESFPTRMRGTASGVVQGLFFLGLSVAPIVFGVLVENELFVLTALTSALVAVAGAAVLMAGRSHRAGAALEELAR